MKIIAGLGNPGAEYDKTRHNVGFMLVDALAEALGAASWRADFLALIAEARIGTEKILLVKPQTYMNDSGRSLGPLLAYYKLMAQELFVAHDDMDIPAGVLRIRKKGSAGGHNGIKSILSHVGDEHFPRIRIGIGRPQAGDTVIHHVLSRFPTEDAKKIEDTIKALIPAVICMVKEGTDVAMNRFNPKKEKKEKKAAVRVEMPTAGAE